MNRYLLLLLAALLAPAGLKWDAKAADLDDVEDLVQIAPMRNMGSSYRRAIDDYVAGRFEATGREHGKITFPTVVYIPGKAKIHLPDGVSLPLYDMTANPVHPANLPDNEWEGRIVDLGKGLPADMKAGNLGGTAAVLDMDSHARWVAPLELGARLLLFCGVKHMTWRDGGKKFSKPPLSVPKFYLTPADSVTLRQALADHSEAKVKIVQTQRGYWKPIVAQSEWVIIPGTTHPDKVVHIQAYKDAASFVPELTPGAESVVNLALFFRLLDYYNKRPSQSTLVFSAVSDHCNLFRGEQFFIAALHTTEHSRTEEEKVRQALISKAKMYAKEYAIRTPEQIARMRTAMSGETKRRLFLKTPIVRHLEYEHNKLRHVLQKARIQEDEAKLKNDHAASERLAKEIKELKDQATVLVHMKEIFVLYGKDLRKFQGERSDDDPEYILNSEEQKSTLAIMAMIEIRFREQLEDFGVEAERIEANGRLAQLLAGKSTLLCLSLDLSFGNDRVGFFWQGAMSGTNNKWQATVSELGRLLDKKVIGEVPGQAEHFTSTRTISGIGWRNHLLGKFPAAASVWQGALVPALTLTTANDLRDLRFTPNDALDNLDKKRASTLLKFSERLITALLEHPKFPDIVRPREDKQYGCSTFRYKLRRYDPYSVEVPEEPVRNAMIVHWRELRTKALLPFTGQVATYQVAMSDRQGGVMFRAHSPSRAVEMYKFDDDWQKIITTIDAGTGARRMPPKAKATNNNWTFEDHTTLLFDCVQTDLVGMYDPVTRAPCFSVKNTPIHKIILLDAARESSPRYYGIAGILEARTGYMPALSDHGIASIFTEKDIPIKIISDKLLLLNATSDMPAGKGFRAGDPRLRRVMYTSAADVLTLTQHRSARLNSKAVRNPASDILYESAVRLIKEGDEKREQGEQATALTRYIAGLGKTMGAYRLTTTTMRDLLKAVAVFLALIIPFSFFMMKLLTPWTDIRAQIAAFVTYFVVTATILAVLHPAFSLSRTPPMIVISFVMLGLSVFVMFLLYGRFDASMKHSMEQAQGVESADSSRNTLFGVAFSVGLNNMRRRRIRTTLTSVTIVLVTFTMLSVISVGQSLAPYRRQAQKTAPYNGVLLVTPGMTEIPESRVAYAKELLSPFGETISRTWTQRMDSQKNYLPYVLSRADGGKGTVDAHVLLGLEPAENGLVLEMPLVAGNWLSSNTAREIILSQKAAATLGISPRGFKPQEIRLHNYELTVVGLVDDTAMSQLTDMVKAPLLPLEMKAAQQQGLTAVQDDGSLSVTGMKAAESPAMSAKTVAPNKCAIIPLGFAGTLQDTTFRAVVLKANSATDAWTAGTHVAQSMSSLTYTGITQSVTQEDAAQTIIAPGQYSLAPPVAGSIGGVGKVLIPICLAATIILNTMMGSVMERKKEISIYNSIGLNPTHVFVFFVAEALVFGMVGAVAGYLIGQALAQLIVAFNWLEGVNLNFSSMAVMLVILGAMVTVVASTLYPAYIATRASVPSGQRRWKVPAPEGDEIHLDFPFSYADEHVPGVCAFLHGFMDLNSEASSGQFLSQNERFGYVLDEADHKVLTMAYDITPVPFDLGVNQKLEVYAYYSEKVRAHVLRMHITRLKGDRTSWLTVNQPFLESLRARLLSWRAQSRENQAAFIEQGKELFTDASEFATRS